MPTRKNLAPRREKRQREARERDAHRTTLTLEQKLALCDARRGESRRERMRLTGGTA